MSAVRCREGNGGKFTRPKRLWTGKRRTSYRAGPAIPPMGAMQAMAGQVAATQFGRLRFKQKTS
jgi:hypothetical protein